MTTILTVLPGPLGPHYQSHLALLEARGIRVVATESAAAAVVLAEECRPQVVVIGQSVPGMGALEMVSLLSELPGPYPAVVVLPDPDEPFNPLVCTVSTRFFLVDYCDLGQIWLRIAQLCDRHPDVAPPRPGTATHVAEQ